MMLWSDREDDMLRTIWHKIPVKEAAAIIGRSEQSCQRRATRIGITRKPNPRPRAEMHMPLPLELAPGHIATDQRSYEVLKGAGV